MSVYEGGRADGKKILVSQGPWERKFRKITPYPLSLENNFIYHTRDYFYNPWE